MSNHLGRKVQLARVLTIRQGRVLSGIDHVFNIEDHEPLPQSVEEVHDLLLADKHGGLAPMPCNCADERSCLDACCGIVAELAARPDWTARRSPR